MKIVIEETHDCEEDQIIFKCRQMTPELFRMLALLKAGDTLIAYSGNEIYRLRPTDIYYIEVVDNKTFFYCKDKVYESKQKLYELEQILVSSEFLRISKSVILNLRKIRTLRPALSGRFDAVLDNGESVIVSRQYVVDLKKKLGI